MYQAETSTKTSGIPLTCPHGHQTYAVWFPQWDSYGFYCGACHTLGSSVTRGQQVLVIRYPGQLVSSAGREDSNLYSHQKATVLCCPKSHYMSLFQIGANEFAFGCGHCKTCSVFIQDRGRLLSVQILRELNREDARRVVENA